LQLDSLCSTEGGRRDKSAAAFRLAKHGRLINLDGLAGRRDANPAAEAPAQVWDLPARHAPLPPMRLVEIRDLRGEVRGAERASEPGVGLYRRRQQMVSQHVAEVHRHAATDCCAESIDAQSDDRLSHRLERQRRSIWCGGIGLRRRQSHRGLLQARLDFARLPIDGRQDGGGGLRLCQRPPLRSRLE